MLESREDEGIQCFDELIPLTATLVYNSSFIIRQNYKLWPSTNSFAMQTPPLILEVISCQWSIYSMLIFLLEGAGAFGTTIERIPSFKLAFTLS